MLKQFHQSEKILKNAMKKFSFCIVLALLSLQACVETELRPQPEEQPLGADASRDNAQGRKQSPALEVEIDVIDDEYPFSFGLTGSGTVTIDWEDGVVETYTLPGEGVHFEVSHAYPIGSGYSPTITGDLHTISGINGFAENGGIVALNGLQHLTGLKDFLPGWFYNASLDLRKNRNLERLDLYVDDLPEWVKLPTRHRIHSFFIFMGDHYLTTAQADEVISSLFRNAVAQNIRGGSMEISNTERPSESSFSKLRTLRDVYGWYVFVDDLPI
jgi:hypothetical protein